MILLDSGYPRDIRVEKEARALLDAGHQVSLLTIQTDKAPLQKETMPFGLEVHRIKPPASNPVRKLRERLTNHFAWAVEPIRQFVETVQPDVVHIHDLPFVRTVHSALGDRNLPLVADFHENMPAAMYVYGVMKKGLGRLAYRWYNSEARWKRFELEAARAVDRVIVVVPEAGARLVAGGVDPARIEVVSNTDTPDVIPANLSLSADAQSYADVPTAIYTGFYGPHRGVDTAIRAAGIVAREYGDAFRLLVVGVRDAAEEAFLRDLARQAGAENVLHLIHWLPEAEVWQYVKAARIGLVPHNDFEHTQTTVPHKLFHFMLADTPVLVSDCAPLKRIVDDAECGLVFRASDPSDMASKWMEMLAAPAAVYTGWQASGSEAAASRYSWHEDAKRLVTMYEELLSDKTGKLEGN